MTAQVPELIEDRPLTTLECKRLSELEGIIERNFKGFIAVGAALAEIRERRLYREKFKTFERYCQELWDIHKNTANQYIAASRVIENLTAIAVKNDDDAIQEKVFFLPANEAQARELAKLEPAEQVQVWKSLLDIASQSKAKITAKTIKKAVLSYKGNQVEVEIDQKVGETRTNLTDFQSEAFTQAFEQFFEQIRIEKQRNWRYTSRKTVYRALQGLIEVVAEAIPGTLDTQCCQMELADREKLQKAGFKIFRMDPKHTLIEQWHHGETWTVHAKFPSAAQLLEGFKELMEDHTHLRG
ncbi:MAG: hypothetical protein P4L42_15600 [Desulfocapsaceae bacterium]|nr:hypothetical protein [Desulfocapsaceae bacterium]